MGYCFAFSACAGCHQPFSYNPIKVPSIRINGIREPICKTCIDRVNPGRIRDGLKPIRYSADAYEPVDEMELP